LDFFTTFRSGESVAPIFGLPAASLAAWAARASGVQALPVITAAAPMTALRIRNERRSMVDGNSEITDSAATSPFLIGSDVFMV
jgi:hypothetical protein